MDILKKTQKIRSMMRKLIMEQERFEDALRLAWFYGDFCRLNYDGFRSDPEIVNYLTDKFETLVALDFGKQIRQKAGENSVVHVITQGYNHGGHTALMLNLVNGLILVKKKQEIIFTDSIENCLAKRISDLGVDVSICGERNLGGLVNLIEKCLQYEFILLHIHPNDIIATISANFLTRQGKQVCFIDHADHSFSFGRESSTLILDVSAFGWNLHNQTPEQCNHSFLGIPVGFDLTLRGKERSHLSRSGGNMISILSVGRPSKYQPMNNISFVHFINKILTSDLRFQISIVGPDGEENWWQGIYSDVRSRVIFHGTVSSVDLGAFYKESTIYVDSFPVPGATAAMEAYLHGCAVFGLSRFSGGYNPIEALFDDDVDSIVSEINKFCNGDGRFREEEIDLRELINSEFSIEATTRRLIDAMNGENHRPPAILDNTSDCYVLYQSPWLEENRIRWPYQTFLNNSALTKMKLVFSYVFGNFRDLSGRDFLYCTRWLFRSN